MLINNSGKKWFLLMFIFLLVGKSFSQQEISLDSLYKKVEYLSFSKQKDSLEKYNALFLEKTKKDSLSYFYNIAILNYANLYRYKDKNAERLAKKALIKFKEIDDEEYILKAYNTITQIKYFKGELDVANRYNDSIILFIKSKKEFKNLTNERKCEFLVGAYSNIAGNYNYQGKYEEALKNILIAKKYTDSVKRIKYPEVDLGIGIINSALFRHKKARKTYKNLIEEYKNSNNKQILAIGYNSLAESFDFEKIIDSALYYYKKSVFISRKINNYQGIASSLRKIGNIEAEKGELNLAENNLKEALKISTEKNIGRIKPEILSALGGVYLKKEEIDLAIKTLKEVIQISKENKRLPIIRDSYRLLSKAYYNKNDFKKALEYRNLYTDFKDSIKSADIIKNTEELQVKFETERKENENLKLKQESAVKDLSITRKNNFILISSLFFILIILSLISYQLKKIRKKNKALKISISNREKIEKELEKVRDNISKDFHDDLGNRLARIATLSDLILSTSSKREKKDILLALKNIKEDSDILYSGTRDFMFSLKSKSDYAEELFTYLSDFGEEFYQPFDIDFFVKKDLKQNLKLPYYWNRQIILIFKEAMTNVAKHSKAKKVILELLCSEKEIEISLFDDGCGFDIEKLKRKNGLLNIKNRALKINADLLINSEEDKTIIKLKAKLP